MKIKGKNILLIQFRDNEELIEHELYCYSQAVEGKIISSVSVFNRNFSWNDPEKILKQHTHIILGGSSEFGLSNATLHPIEKQYIGSTTRDLLSLCIKEDHPLLGICFGHHLIAYAERVPIIRSPEEKEIGTVDVSLTKNGKNDPLFHGFSDHFQALTAHIESVSRLPDNAALLATTKKSRICAFKIKKHIYSLQFHPELTKNTFLQRLRLVKENSYVLEHPIKPVSTAKIIRNFISI